MKRRHFLQLAELAGVSAATLGSLAATAAGISRQPSPPPNAHQTTADILVETLIAWAAPFVFGVVGDGVNSVIEALRRRQDRIRYIGVRHEEAAAFMASGIAKHTGRLGVCLGTTGPGTAGTNPRDGLDLPLIPARHRQLPAVSVSETEPDSLLGG